MVDTLPDHVHHSIKELVNMGVAIAQDGYTDSKKNIMELLQKDKLTDDEKVEFMFYADIFISCT